MQKREIPNYNEVLLDYQLSQVVGQKNN